MLVEHRLLAVLVDPLDAALHLLALTLLGTMQCNTTTFSPVVRENSLANGVQLDVHRVDERTLLRLVVLDLVLHDLVLQRSQIELLLHVEAAIHEVRNVVRWSAAPLPSYYHN